MRHQHPIHLAVAIEISQVPILRAFSFQRALFLNFWGTLKSCYHSTLFIFGHWKFLALLFLESCHPHLLYQEMKDSHDCGTPLDLPFPVGWKFCFWSWGHKSFTLTEEGSSEIFWLSCFFSLFPQYGLNPSSVSCFLLCHSFIDIERLAHWMGAKGQVDLFQATNSILSFKPNPLPKNVLISPAQ